MTLDLPILEIKDLKASINNNEILKSLNLTIKRGEIHAIMGPNGSGKSTFSKIIAGHPAYEVISGDILFNGSSILDLDPEERSHLGIFLAFPICNNIFSFGPTSFCNKIAEKRYLFKRLCDRKIS